MVNLDPYIILIVGCSSSWKKNTLLDLISHQLDINKTYLCAKDRYQGKCQFLISGDKEKV